jgi:NADPH:quinone reductase-like Zn-dependent oxidoreductase
MSHRRAARIAEVENTMKAAFIERHGGPEVLKYGDLPDPTAGPGEVVIDIVAASVNGADWKVRVGDYKQSKFPYVLGRDFSGVISAVGAGVEDLHRGDAVFGVCEAGQEGAYAEKIAVKAAIVAKKPAALSHVDAAALALTGLTALSAIEDTLKLKRGETILIQGGAGGVAGFAIQLAKHIGARVITTTSAANRDYVRSLGADEVIDYNTQDFTQVAKNCDAVFDTVGGDVAQRSFAVLKPGGRAAFIASGAQAPKPDRDDVASLRPPVGRARRHIERIAELYAAGAVRPPEIKLYRLSEAINAHRLSQSRHFRGKLVFQVR